jgi:hypothetical protein
MISGLGKARADKKTAQGNVVWEHRNSLKKSTPRWKYQKVLQQGTWLP